jgi:hypothetical protein
MEFATYIATYYYKEKDKVATKKAAKQKSTALVPWTEKFAQYAKQSTEQVKNVGVTGVSVKFGHGTIEVAGKPVPSGKLECVILGSCALNAWNQNAYDPNNTQPPDCYAFATVYGDKDMMPHPQAPLKQSTTCADCEKNQFGTASTGKGKACANTIRMGLLVAGDIEDADAATAAEMATAKASPTNAKHFKAYVDMLEAEYHRPPWSVITEISSLHDDATQIRLEFKLVDPIDDDDILTALEKRFLKIQDVLQQPFNAAAPKAAPKPNAKYAGKGKRK